jgi:metal-sulfur cluster biosynthetic enzyme
MTDKPSAPPTSPCPNADQVCDILRQVIDPEAGIDIVAMGLVYRIDVTPDRLLIEMSMTSPACPMGEMILDDVRAALKEALPESISFEVSLVWEPPWNPSMMDEATRRQFGW